MAQRDLRKIARLAARIAACRAEMQAAILAAHESGESIRDIAPYADMSPSRVHEILLEARRERETNDPNG